MKALIIDDEPLARMIIREYLSRKPEIEILGECGDGFEGAKAINEHKPDLVFLDVQMPKLTGFEMLEILDNVPHIVFTTAFEEFALKAFEKSAVDYLLKPISEDRFEQAVQKFKLLHDSKRPSPNIQALKTEIEEENLERIVVKNGAQIKLIPIQHVIYLEAYDDYVKIHTNEGMFLKNKTMASFEKQLDPKQFVRVHRSFIVRVEQIGKIEPMEKESYRGTLLSGDKVNISKSGYARLKQTIGL